MEPDKEIREDAKLKNLVQQDAQAAEDLWRFRYPEEGGTKLTFDAILVEVPLRYGFTVSLSTLSEFYSWFKRRRRIEAARAAAEQGKRDMAMLDPEASLADLEAYAQFVFTNECLETGDKLNFARLKKIRQGDRKQAQDDRRLAQNDRQLEFESRRIAILERKAEQADAAKDVSDNDELTPEQKTAKLKQIFRMG
jgi:hypothetical protein